MHEAKTNLSKLIEQAEAGEDVIIARRDTPAVRIVPVARSAKRVFGAYKGEAGVTPAFFDALPEDELALWDGGTVADAPARRPMVTRKTSRKRQP